MNEIVPREYVPVVDASGSMHRCPLATAKTLLRKLTRRLRPSDSFNVIPFAVGHSLLVPASLPAASDDMHRATRFIDGQTGRGTELLPVLLRVLALPADTGHTGTARGGDEAQALKQLWARGRVAQLADLQKLGEDNAAKREILALGLKYVRLADDTSLIAVDKASVNRGGTGAAVDQPQPLPEGVDETALAALASTPEPEFAALAALAGALTWWMRRRRRADEARETGRE